MRAAEGFAVNQKRVHRLYRCVFGPPARVGKKRTCEAREPIAAPTRLNQRSSMDVIPDTLASGRRIPGLLRWRERSR
jgi:hypothetical protein